MKLNNQYYFPLLLSCTFVLGLLFGYNLKISPVKNNNTWLQISKDKKALNEALTLIENNYYQNTKTSPVVDRAIYEMFDNLDPYSMYIPAYHSDMLAISNSGKYKGVGIETIDFQGNIYLSKILDGSPADSSKMLKGSKFVSVNSIDITNENWNSDSLARFIRNDSNSPLTFELSHFNYSKNQRIEVTPGEVKLPNISDVKHIAGSIGYVQISKFGTEAYKDFMTALEGLMVNDSLQNLIIDVRNNPGGYLQEVCKIISQLITERVEFLTTVDADGNSKSYKSTGQSFFHIGNIIILINEESASASEILAGVLQDLDRAIVIGVNSFGKGLVQEQFELSNGGNVRMSVSRYKLPSGRFIGEKDSLAYHTLRLEREVKGTGNVKPDFMINHAFYKHNVDLFKASLLVLQSENINSHEMDLKSFTPEELASELASIRNESKDQAKNNVISDPVIQKGLELLSEKDEWGILK